MQPTFLMTQKKMKTELMRVMDQMEEILAILMDSSKVISNTIRYSGIILSAELNE